MDTEMVDGFYVRNGPNPWFEPRGDHHLFDGDGMIHAVKIRNGKASYSCRFTKTKWLMSEEQVGEAFIPSPSGNSTAMADWRACYSMVPGGSSS